MTKPTFFPLRSGIVVLIPILGACASSNTPPPTAQISQAELAVESAAQAQATEYAPLELRKAQENMREARQLIDKEEFEQAERFAEKAIVEAQLAQAKAEAQVALNALDEVRNNINTLQQEGQRSIDIQSQPTK